MLGHKENFPTTGENSDDVGVWVAEGSHSHVLFCSEKLVEAFDFGVFVNEDDLSAILDHAMTWKAEEGKHSQVGVILAKTIQLADSIIAVFQLGLYQRQELVRTESESGDQFLEVAVVSEYAW